MPMTTGRMTIERLSDILDAYGADPLRWPESERLTAQALAAREPRAAALVADAMATDALLDAAPAEAPSPALVAAILKGRPQRPLLVRIWRGLFPEMPVWRPALGMAAALAIGFGIQTAAADRLFDDGADVTVADESGEVLAPLSGSDLVTAEDTL